MNIFTLEDHHRFARMLLLAVFLHSAILLYFTLNFYPCSLPPLKKSIATLFEASANLQANNHQPRVALNIAPHKNQSTDFISSVNDIALDQIPVLIPKLDADLTPSQSDFVIKELGWPKETTHLRKRTISAAAHESKDAAYLAKWQLYIEQFGNTHYPQSALQNNLQGNLRLLVAVNKDGSLHAVNIRQSSGSALLDAAAINIVTLAAPFEPLPPEIAKDTDVLEIIRTWQFLGKLSTS